MSDDLDKYQSRFILELQTAERNYLRSCGWTKNSKGLWTTGGITVFLTQNHAVTVCKASDPNMGVL